jgi:hypothetical protein
MPVEEAGSQAIRDTAAAGHAVHKLCEIAENTRSFPRSHASQNFSILLNGGTDEHRMHAVQNARPHAK